MVVEEVEGEVRVTVGVIPIHPLLTQLPPNLNNTATEAPTPLEEAALLPVELAIMEAVAVIIRRKPLAFIVVIGHSSMPLEPQNFKFTFTVA